MTKRVKETTVTNKDFPIGSTEDVINDLVQAASEQALLIMGDQVVSNQIESFDVGAFVMRDNGAKLEVVIRFTAPCTETLIELKELTKAPLNVPVFEDLSRKIKKKEGAIH